MYYNDINIKKVESVSTSVSKEIDSTGINWDERLEIGLGYLGLSPTEFWDLTPVEYNYKLAGFHKLQEVNYERDLICAYFSTYGMVPRGKGKKTKTPDQFVMSFLSEKRRNEIHKSKIQRIKNKIQEGAE